MSILQSYYILYSVKKESIPEEKYNVMNTKNATREKIQGTNIFGAPVKTLIEVKGKECASPAVCLGVTSTLFIS